MAVALSIADNANGTGGVATISGSAGGSTNTLYKAAFTGAMGAQTWTSVGSRSGDGTITFSGTGWFLWRVDSLLAGVTEVATYFQNLTDAATEAVLYSILGAVETQVKAIGLSGISNTQVLKKWVPRAVSGIDTVPTVQIAPMERESFPEVMTTQDDIGYPVVIAAVDKQNQDHTANLNRNLLWRQQLLSKFRWQRLQGVTKVMYAEPIPTEILDKQAWTNNYFQSLVGFNFVTRQTRG